MPPAPPVYVDPAFRQRRSPEPEPAPLGSREWQILAQAAVGRSCGETAQRLGVTVNTVKTARKKVVEKLGAVNITHAVHLAHRQGWLDQFNGRPVR